MTWDVMVSVDDWMKKQPPQAWTNGETGQLEFSVADFQSKRERQRNGETLIERKIIDKETKG